jgi:ABC-type nitrate/sulfonate/bicarbonate transport system permease component
MSALEWIWEAVLPSVAPSAASGMRVSLGIAMMVVVTAEMFVGSTGLGRFILIQQQRFQVANTYAGLVLLLVSSLLLSAGFQSLERRVVFWAPAGRGRRPR